MKQIYLIDFIEKTLQNMKFHWYKIKQKSDFEKADKST